MKEPPALPDETARLEVLYALDLLDTPPEPDFDGFVSLAQSIAETPIALLTLVDENRQWFKARVGLDVPETPRRVSFCGHTIVDGDPLIVENALDDERFCDNPLVLGAPHIRFYAGFPLEVKRRRVGTLCVVDTQRRTLTPSQQALLARLAEQVQYTLAWRSQLLTHAGQTVATASQTPALLQMIVHDLAAPLTSILVNADVVMSDPVASVSCREAAHDVKLAGGLLQRMVRDLLDIGLSGDTQLSAHRQPTAVGPLLRNLASRLRAALVGRGQSLVLDIDDIDGLQAALDPDLITRMIANLIGNSAKYAPSETPIALRCRRDGEMLRIEVIDDGPGIPVGWRERVFDVGARLERDANRYQRTSRGLGLAFCRLAATAHGGDIWVDERDDGAGSRFCVELPLR